MCKLYVPITGSTAILISARKNQSAEVNHYVPSENNEFDVLKTLLKKDKGPQSPKAITRKLRYRRNVMQMARMLKCMSGCNPLSYRGYGCYCGYMGSGQPVDDIDR